MNGHMKAQIRFQQRAFNKSFSLIAAMSKYEHSEDPEDLKQLFLLSELANFTAGNHLPLPSRRIGNVIALALECGYFASAEQLINHSDEIKLDVKALVRDLDGECTWSLKDEFQYSVAISDVSKKLDDLETFNGGQGNDKILRDYYIKSLAAIQRIDTTLNLSGEELDFSRN